MNLLAFLLRASRRVVALSILSGLVAGLGGVGLIALVHTGLTQDGQATPRAAWAFAGLCLLTAINRVVAQAATVRLAQGAVARLAVFLCERIAALPLRRFEEIETARFVTILTEDIVIVANALIGIPLLGINAPIIFACFAYVGWLSPTILACALGFALPILVVDRLIMASGLRHLRRAGAGQDALVAQFRSLIDGFRELKVHRGRRETFLSRTVPDATEAVRERMVAGLSRYAAASGWSQAAYFGFIGFILFGLPAFHPIDRPTLSGAVLVVLYVMSPLEILLTWIPIMGRAQVSLHRIEALIPELGTSSAPEAPAHVDPLPFRESLELRGVRYAYQRDPEGGGFVLGPIRLAIQPGELIVLVGGNGSGKTTLVKLLAGLYEPDAGTIRLDGRPIAAEDQEAYRQLFSVVFADGHLFGDLHGLDPTHLDARAQEGLERLGLAGLVQVREGVFSTTALSQGQRRRLALLAACLEDRPICIFDEWAAHQDPHFKRIFYRELLPELKARGKTIVVISHDEAYFSAADRVVRLQEGLISEDEPADLGGDLARLIGHTDSGASTRPPRDASMKKLIAILIILWGGGGLGYWYWDEANAQRVAFRTVHVERGDLRATIDATGTIEPEDVVDVGAQIAGQIESFGDDPREPGRPISYGSPVERDTVLAQLDASLYRARVDQAKASLTRAKADVLQAEAKLRQAERDLDRVKKLQARNMVAAQDVDAALANQESAEAGLAVVQSSVAVAEADLEEASVNLGYATIRSPVKGVILDRRVNIGQTVVASLNAPSLFLIAKDLARMEIWASVNETDVGAIRVGQIVRFTVGAFPGETFEGKVSQIRLNASMTQSVVTYTVVIGFDNKGGRLLPYLTARLEFEVDERRDVLLLPNSALRWKPSPQHIAPESRTRYAEISASRKSGTPDEPPESASPQKPGLVWVQQGEFVRPIEVRTGLTDGILTEIAGSGLDEGTEIVVGQAHQDDPAAAGSTSPFLPKIKNDKSKK